MGETLQLCKAEPAISDIDSLDILHRTLQKMDDHTELRSTIWEKAAKAKPQDHTLQMRWFTLGFEAADWKTAQKVGWRLMRGYLRTGMLTIRSIHVGCHEPSKELPSGAKILFLGHLPVPYHFRKPGQLRDGPQAFRDPCLSDDFESGC